MKEYTQIINETFKAKCKNWDLTKIDRVLCEYMILVIEDLVQKVEMYRLGSNISDLNVLSDAMLYDVIRNCADILIARTQGDY
ncbi:hypothetical protein M0R04_09255 [Candidatus Dojkabacteria bacterium]|jgi:hypothetical protein|nr:hypothetical protein [Candidatus Dojkabacteria bacterium]